MSGKGFNSYGSQIPILLERLKEISLSMDLPLVKRNSFRTDAASIIEDCIADVTDAHKKARETIKLAHKFHKAYQKASTHNDEIIQRNQELVKKVEEMESQMIDQEGELISKDQRCEGLMNDLADIEKALKTMTSENSLLRKEIITLKREITQNDLREDASKKVSSNQSQEREKEKSLQNEIASLNLELEKQKEENEELSFKIRELDNLLQTEKGTSGKLRNFISELKGDNLEFSKEIEGLKQEKMDLNEKILNLKNELIQHKSYNEQLVREYDNQRRRATLSEMPKELKAANDAKKVPPIIMDLNGLKESSSSDESLHTSEGEEESEIILAQKKIKAKAPPQLEETLGDFFEGDEQSEAENKLLLFSSPKSNFNISTEDSTPKENKVFVLSSPKGQSKPAYTFETSNENELKICHYDDIHIAPKTPSSFQKNCLNIENNESILIKKTELKSIKSKQLAISCSNVSIYAVKKLEVKSTSNKNFEIETAFFTSLLPNKIRNKNFLSINSMNHFSIIWPKLALSVISTEGIVILKLKQCIEVQTVQNETVKSLIRFSQDKTEGIAIQKLMQPFEVQTVQNETIRSVFSLSLNKSNEINIHKCLRQQKEMTIKREEQSLEIKAIRKEIIKPIVQLSLEKANELIIKKSMIHHEQNKASASHPLIIRESTGAKKFSLNSLENIHIKPIAKPQAPISNDSSFSKKSQCDYGTSRDPIKDLFIFICQAAKLNSKYRDRLGWAPVDHLYDECLENNIPFNEWHDYVKLQLEKDFELANGIV